MATTKISAKTAKSKDFQNGKAMRSKILGADYVNGMLANASETLVPFQELLTEFAWGKVWTRGVIDLKTRSMLTLAMCIALGKPHEIKLHLRGCVRMGVSNKEITELLLHAFIYCGGPACVDAATVIREHLPEIEAQERPPAAKKAARKAAAPKPKAARKTA
jgi:4-carboxymuconolactone decarboxylase